MSGHVIGNPQRTRRIVRRVGRRRDVIVPTVEVAVEFEKLRLICVDATEPQGHERRFGAAAREPHCLRAWHQPAHPFRPFNFAFVARSVMRPLGHLLLNGRHHIVRRVPQNQRAVAVEVVDQFVTIDAPLPTALRPFDVRRKRIEQSQIVRHAVRQQRLRHGMASLRFRKRGNESIDNPRHGRLDEVSDNLWISPPTPASH